MSFLGGKSRFGQLRLSINEPREEIYVEYLVADFEGAVEQLSHGAGLDFSYEGTTLVLLPNSIDTKDKNRSMRFLEALKYALEAHLYKFPEPTPKQSTTKQ